MMMSITKFAIATSAAALVSVPAYATNYNLVAVPTGPGSYSYNISDSAPSSGTTTDTFTFDTPTDGTVSIGILNVGTGTNNIDFTSATLTGTPSPVSLSVTNVSPLSLANTFSDVPVMAGVEYVLSVTYAAGAEGAQFNGNVAFTSGVPEAGAWAMMIIGFGFIGAALRFRTARPKHDMVVRYS
jgi:hypothetical protein